MVSVRGCRARTRVLRRGQRAPAGQRGRPDAPAAPDWFRLAPGLDRLALGQNQVVPKARSSDTAPGWYSQPGSAVPRTGPPWFRGTLPVRGEFPRPRSAESGTCQGGTVQARAPASEFRSSINAGPGSESPARASVPTAPAEPPARRAPLLAQQRRWPARASTRSGNDAGAASGSGRSQQRRWPHLIHRSGNDAGAPHSPGRWLQQRC